MEDKIQHSKPVPPFVRFCAANIPMVFDDSLSYYEALCALWKWLQTDVIDVINNNAAVTQTWRKELTEFEGDLTLKFNNLSDKFDELKNYVDTYFDNLDVQEEINHKLDEMVDDGTLQEIVGAYLNATAVWGFDTVADMLASTNLIAGSYAKTLGYYALNDKGGATYKIRTRTFDDSIDNGSLIAYGDDLVAELEINEYVSAKQFGCYGDGTHDDTTQMQRAVNYACDHELPLNIESGTYRISQILATKRIVIKGAGINNTILKSTDVNSGDAIIKLLNDGMQWSEISDITVDGNNWTGTHVSGIKLYCDSNSGSLDRHTYLHRLKAMHCSAHGIEVNTESTDYVIRELRMFNVETNNNKEDGIHLENCTDSNYGFITSYSNIHYGYNMYHGGPHKFVNCKAFLNGIGDETTLEDLNRIPSAAFTATSDPSPVVGKTYYTRSGKGVNGNWYKFTEFVGDSFDDVITYYEKSDTGTYYKRYAGFRVHMIGSAQFTNCESQDNYGDGFDVYSCNNCQFDGIDVDNNGFISFDETYSELGLHPLYYGVYCDTNWRLQFQIAATNWRYAAGLTDKVQAGALYMKDMNIATGNVLSTVQYYGDNQIFVEAEGANYYTYMDSINMHINGVGFKFVLDLSDLTLPTGYEISSLNVNDMCYMFKQDGIIHYRFKIKNTSGIFPSTGNVTLFTLPAAFKPAASLFTTGILSDYDGYAGVDDANVIFETGSGNVVANNYNVISAVKTLSFNGSYPDKRY